MNTKDDTLKKIIADRIRELQEQKGLTQEKLAYQSEISKGGLSEILSYKKLPNILTTIKICAGLDIDIKEFFDFKEMNNFKDSL